MYLVEKKQNVIGMKLTQDAIQYHLLHITQPIYNWKFVNISQFYSN